MEPSDLDPEFGQADAEYSLKHLREVLSRRGVASTGFGVSWDEFRDVRGPMIVHLEAKTIGFRHFHVARWDGDALWVLEPLASHPIKLDAAQQATYREQFTGRILVPVAGIPLSWRVRSALWVVPIAALALCLPALVRIWRARNSTTRTEGIASPNETSLSTPVLGE